MMVASRVAPLLLLVGFCHALVVNPSRQTIASRLSQLLLLPEPEEEQDLGLQRQPRPERPTQTEVEVIGPDIEPEKPKIVVLGASGRIGRLVVQQLMEMRHIDMTVIAFVRDLDKAKWALFDDLLVPRLGPRKKGPNLQLALGNLVPPQEVAGFNDRAEERDWRRRAKSASDFYGTKVQDYDNRDIMNDDSHNEALEEAIQGATTIISCVGAVRPSNVWSDYVCFWRLFSRDASKWCRDAKHPYYVHYESTRKALDLAEQEQNKREEARRKRKQEDEKKDAWEKSSTEDAGIPDRIRFIRISDLILSRKPWMFIPVLTNMVQSMVFRYQDMTERLLEESSVVDTIILRPGDLTDEERDTDITHLQVCESGKLPYPAVVGREDVASLAVSSALFQLPNTTSSTNGNSDQDKQEPQPPMHMNLAVRWCGELDPPHAGFQGEKYNGNIDAHAALQKVLYGNEGSPLRRKKQRVANPTMIRKFAQKLTRRRLKPYAIFVAIPVYIMLTMLVSSLLPYVLGTQHASMASFPLSLPQLRATLKGASSSILEKIPNMGRWVSLQRGNPKYISI